MKWIRENIGFIEHFTLLKLFSYVEKNNPNMPGVSLKLFRPRHRKLAAPTLLWKSFVENNSNAYYSVFERKPLNQIANFSIDHFLPWSFLTHDQLWNLHPIEHNVNCIKGNLLPDNKYFGSFCDLQYHFMRFLVKQKPNLVADYNAFLLVSNSDLQEMPSRKFGLLLKSRIETEYQFALNRGFGKGWVYLAGSQQEF